MSLAPSRKRKEFHELSKQQQDKLKLAEQIERYGLPAEWSCERCFKSLHECVVMPSRPDLKCARCTQLGKSCVKVSWDSLDRIRDQKAAEIADAKEKLRIANAEAMKMMEEVVRRQAEAAKLLESINRNEKVLNQAHERAKAKTICMLEEIQEEEEAGRSNKRKRSSSDDSAPGVQRSLGVGFDDLVTWPEEAPHPNWDVLGGLGGIGQLGPVPSEGS
jgi:hypothetical protein